MRVQVSLACAIPCCLSIVLFGCSKKDPSVADSSPPSNSGSTPPGDKKPADVGEDLRVSGLRLKEIANAFHSYHDSNKSFPNDVYSKDGTPLRSWRVEILPYLKEEKLYAEFQRDEPWDSPRNRALIVKMPQVYAPVRVKANPGETFYRGFTGNGAGFERDKKLFVGEFLDGVMWTGLIFEAFEPSIWTKPSLMPFPKSPEDELPKLGGLFDGYFQAVSAGGSVSLYRKDIPKDQLRLVIKRDDGKHQDVKNITVDPSEVIAKLSP